MILYFINNHTLQSRRIVNGEVKIDVYLNVNV